MYYIERSDGKLVTNGTSLKRKAQFAAHLYANDGLSFTGRVFRNVIFPHKIVRDTVATIKNGEVLTPDGNDWLASFDHNR